MKLKLNTVDGGSLSSSAHESESKKLHVGNSGFNSEFILLLSGRMFVQRDGGRSDRVGGV